MWPFSVPYLVTSPADLLDEYDYVVVGGGTAGCLLANRLSADPSTTVLVLERGPVTDSWKSRVPLFSAAFDSSPYSHKLMSTTNTPGGRSLDVFAGNGLGGSTLINHMFYTRGSSAQYDAWQRNGAKGWDSEALLEYSIKSENAQWMANPTVHGTKGEWVNSQNDGFFYPGFQLSVDASEELGLSQITDPNDLQTTMVGWTTFPVTRDLNGHRMSTARAFLPPPLLQARHANLHVCVNSIVEQLLLETVGADVVARAVVFGPTTTSDQASKSRQIGVRREVVLCAGAIGSPKVLLLSGIGPADHLKPLDIPLVKDLPVGENLQDHFGVFLQYFAPIEGSLLRIQHQLLYLILQILQYLFFGTGALLAPVLQMAIFVSTTLLDERGVPSKQKAPDHTTIPDIEVMPLAYASGTAAKDKTRGGFSYLAVLLTPNSRGTVRLASADARADPIVDLNYLADHSDRVRMRQGIKFAQRIAEGVQRRGYSLDGADVPTAEDDEALDAHIADQGTSAYHYSSTCSIGRVVGNDLVVFGTRNVRVADASVFPDVPACHLQAPVVAVAEKCADMMLRREKN